MKYFQRCRPWQHRDAGHLDLPVEVFRRQHRLTGSRRRHRRLDGRRVPHQRGEAVLLADDGAGFLAGFDLLGNKLVLVPTPALGLRSQR